MQDLKTIRIQTKLDELFDGKIDLSDAKENEDKQNKYYSRAIAALAIVMQCGIDCESAAKTITDGYQDMGIDAVYNDATQKKLILVQSKWRKNSNKGVSQEELYAFVNGVKRIIGLEFDGCNQKIKAKESEIIDALHDTDYQIKMIFCHTGSQGISAHVRQPIDELLAQTNGDSTTELLVFDESKLQDIYDYLASAQNSDDIVLDDVLLYNWGVIEAPYKAYYGTIPVTAIGAWFTKYGNSLFAKNIRYYKGSTEVNQSIKEVLKNEPDKFFYYNNGIKILCKKIDRKAAYSTDRNAGLFVLEGVSLVNGAQTTGTIGAVYDESPKLLDSAYAYIQIIDLSDASEEQATKITKLSNTQNRIENKDFASLDPNQERLRRDLGFEGIQYLYKDKAGAKVDSPKRQISLDEAIVAQACALDDLAIIARVKGNIGALTDDIEKPPYKLLFNDSTDSFSLYNNVQVLRAVDRCISQHESTDTSRKRLVLIHGNRYLLHKILKGIRQKEEFETGYMEEAKITSMVEKVFMEVWESVYASMEKHFPSAYPAYIFKSAERLKTLES